MTWYNNWNEYLLTENKEYNQVIYKIIYDLVISKQIGGNKTQTLNDIRKIPEVTTVFRMEKGYEDDEQLMAPYSIKFALKRGENPDIFLRKILRPSLKRIKGLSIQGSKGLEKVGL